MKSEVKSYTLTIAGQSYTISSDEDKALLEKAAHKVEEVLSSVTEHAPRAPLEKKALLVALQIAHELCKQQAEAYGAQVAIDAMMRMLNKLEIGQ